MKLICKLVGHTIDPERYGRIAYTTVDGMDTVHATIDGVCERCEERIRVIKIHMPKVKSVIYY